MIDYLDELGEKSAIDQGFEELKRVDHLIFVSLKYTRTVDVIKSVLDRMILAFDSAIAALLNQKKQEDPELDIPTTPIKRGELVKSMYTQQIIQDGMELYLLLRKIARAEYQRESEYRRHVTMKVIIEGEEINVDIDKTVELYEQIKEFMSFVSKMLKGGGE